MTCKTPCAIDGPELRAQRVLYPITARILAFGQAAWMHWSLLLVNLLSLLAISVLVGILAVEAGAPRWLGVVAGAGCLTMTGFMRDLPDPYGSLLAVLTVFLLYRRQWLPAAIVAAMAVLTREQLVLWVPFLFVPYLLRREYLRAGIAWAIILGTFGTWQVIMHSWHSNWAILASSQTVTADKHPLLVPFASLWANAYTKPDLGIMVLCVVIPITLASVIGAMVLLRNGWRGVLDQLKTVDGALALTVILATISTAMTSASEWADIWACGRIAIPILIWGLILAIRSGLPERLRTSYTVLAAIPILIPLLITVTLY